MIGQNEERYFPVGAQLPPLERAELVRFLKNNMDMFAWNAYDALGIDPEFICHRLNVNSNVVPRRQPPRRFSIEHAKAVMEEVNKLKQVG